MKNKSAKNLEIPKYIKNTSKILSKLHLKLAIRFALRLFETPIRFKLPKREQKMFDVSQKTNFKLPQCQKEIVVYENVHGSKKVLLVHGWSGRGTQLVSIAKAFKELNYTIISFDGPGHGKSPKTTTNMKDFIEAIFEMEKKYGVFDVIIGHSLGGMSVINSLGRGLKARKAIIIGSGNKTEDIVISFLKNIGMKTNSASMFTKLFERKYNEKMSDYDVETHAKSVDIPVLIVHDHDDLEVPVQAAEQIHKKLACSQLLITHKLGHRKILGDEKVIESILDFVESSN